MAKKFRIGLNYFFNNETNSGIVNYIFNIISALNTLPDELKPEVIVFYSDDAPTDYLKSIRYPYIRFLLFCPRPVFFPIKMANSILKRIFKRDLFRYIKYFRHIDCLYPYLEFKDRYFKEVPNKIHWLVDFNNKAFPEHYDDKGLRVSSSQERVTADQGKVVLSSLSLFHELKRYYPNYRCRVRILPFASSLPELSDEQVHQVATDHGIDTPYLMSPNQFWQHKNQGIVLDAIRQVKAFAPEFKFKVLFSGSITVNRGRGKYVEELNMKIAEYGLSEYVQFMGILDRHEQLLLMKGAVALIQPSLYEGWSTLVEEAKALGKFIILSDIPVHREQISYNADFFDPYDSASLAKKILDVWKCPPKTTGENYRVSIEQFGKNILDAFKSS